ncbi:KxYKxGKxW signal peptide domain-containing protein, partial [uncultured Limosilactobacillus sp.]
MEVRKHYKMYKKGKTWCYMALATIAAATGMA